MSQPRCAAALAACLGLAGRSFDTALRYRRVGPPGEREDKMYDDVSRELVVARPDNEYVVRMAVTGFLAGYSGLTRDAYAVDHRTFWRWCADHGLGLFAVRRTHIELFARWLEQERSRATHERALTM